MPMSKKMKIILISSISTVLAAAILVGALWYFGNRGDPVKVIPLSYCTTDYYDYSMQNDGTVTADNLQTIYPTDTLTVTEIFVTEGQQVKKGDKLLSYDTTLTDIQLERKRIGVQQAELDLQNAQKELAAINAMVPYSPPPETEPTREEPTEPLQPEGELPKLLGGDGTRERPYRWLWEETLSFDDAFAEAALGGKSEVWLCFELRQSNAAAGELLQCWGLHITAAYGDDAAPQLRYSFFVPDPESAEEPEGEGGFVWEDNSSGYTAAEIAQMRREKEREIRDLDTAFRLAQVEYERMTKEAENGMVYAEVDGAVTALNDAETAMNEGLPLMMVSGGGCFYVQVPIGEYDLEKYAAGTPVEINSWMSGVTTEGTLESVSNLPTNGYYYGAGNPNVSTYSAMIAVDASSGLQEGEYVSVSFAPTGAEDDTLYLENIFIRSENGSAYVYKRDGDGTLVKVTVTLGSSLWGSYTAVYGDLSAEDWIAFPYGKDVKEGAKTVESSYEDFYY